MIPVLWRFLRENLWPIIALITFGFVLWATLSLTTLTQEKENRRVLMAKSLPEELRLAKSEGIFPPKSAKRPDTLPISPEKDAALVYAQIDAKKIQGTWQIENYQVMSRYMETWTPPHRRNPMFDAQIDAFLEKNADVMKIAERASRLPLSSVDTEKDPDMLRRELVLKDLFFLRIYRRGESDIVKSIAELKTIIKIKSQFNHNQPDHYFEIVIIRLFRNIYKYCIVNNKSQEIKGVLEIINTFKIVPFDSGIYHNWRIKNTIKKIKNYKNPEKEKKKLDNPLLIKTPKEDVFLDINAYVRFLDSANNILQSKIYGEGFGGDGPYYLVNSLHEIRLVQKRQQENLEKRSPRQEWKFYQAIEAELKKKYSDGYWGGYSSGASSYLLRLVRWRQTMTMIALYEYKEQYGTFPENLADLPPNTPIIDPITEKPFLWKWDSQRGWLLYSPGLDEKDNGGKDRDMPSEVRDIVVVMGK
jgi:hypothetical protein